MKRYLVFFGSVYYPSGGMEDFVGATDDVDTAKKILDDEILLDFNPEYEDEKEYREYKQEYSWGHIFDTIDFKIVYRLNDNNDFSLVGDFISRIK